jgi:hypothetical protein
MNGPAGPGWSGGAVERADEPSNPSGNARDDTCPLSSAEQTQNYVIHD